MNQSMSSTIASVLPESTLSLAACLLLVLKLQRSFHIFLRDLAVHSTLVEVLLWSNIARYITLRHVHVPPEEKQRNHLILSKILKLEFIKEEKTYAIMNFIKCLPRAFH